MGYTEHGHLHSKGKTLTKDYDYVHGNSRMKSYKYRPYSLEKSPLNQTLIISSE
jgi:hypothetical protein